MIEGDSISKAAIKEGYSEKYANSGHLTQGKIWNELTEEYLCDVDLLKIHQKLLNKQEVITRNNNKTGMIEVVPTGEIDSFAVKSALEMAYKLKNRYDNTITIKGKLSGLSDEEIRTRIAGILSGIVGTIAGSRKTDTGSSG